MNLKGLVDIIHPYFLPHRETHQRAKFLSWHFLIIYILLFMLLRVGIDLGQIYKPGVLGINSNIIVEQVINDTNQERVKVGLSTLHENQMLDSAAYEKAKNMFSENYWAHYSPSGKDPWGFINGAGYKFTYAGENLARNFYNSDEVVKAWMNSPSHRENILGPNYQEIGIAVVDGVLQGQKTTLVVQMFGTPSQIAVANPNQNPSTNLAPAAQTTGQNSTLGTSNLVSQVKIDPFLTVRDFGLLLMLFIGLLLVTDFVVLKRRGVFRLSSHHLAHLSFLAITATTLVSTHAGQIL